jgi:hypothetical protein
MEVAIGIAGIIVGVLTYFAGVRHGRRTADESYQQGQQDKLVDEYVRMARSNYASGVYSLAMLGMEILGTDAAIRNAIQQMQVRTASDPWSGKAAVVANVDLVRFFRYVREQKVNFAQRSVEDVAAAVVTRQENE